MHACSPCISTRFNRQVAEAQYKRIVAEAESKFINVLTSDRAPHHRSLESSSKSQQYSKRLHRSVPCIRSLHAISETSVLKNRTLHYPPPPPFILHLKHSAASTSPKHASAALPSQPPTQRMPMSSSCCKRLAAANFQVIARSLVPIRHLLPFPFPSKRTLFCICSVLTIKQLPT